MIEYCVWTWTNDVTFRTGVMGFFDEQEAIRYRDNWNTKGKGLAILRTREYIEPMIKSLQSFPLKVDHSNPIYTNSIWAHKNIRGNFKP